MNINLLVIELELPDKRDIFTLLLFYELDSQVVLLINKHICQAVDTIILLLTIRAFEYLIQLFQNMAWDKSKPITFQWLQLPKEYKSLA